jgi:hypothetical protein
MVDDGMNGGMGGRGVGSGGGVEEEPPRLRDAIKFKGPYRCRMRQYRIKNDAWSRTDIPNELPSFVSTPLLDGGSGGSGGLFNPSTE